jgi:hypothetical protein
MLLRVLLSTLALASALSACRPTNRPPTTHHHEAATPADQDRDLAEYDEDLEDREVVPNYAAETGDVTVCPYSGRKFEVKADSPRLKWKGKSWVLCSSEPMAEIQASPDKYLGKFLDEDVDGPGDVDQPKPTSADEPPE